MTSRGTTRRRGVLLALLLPSLAGAGSQTHSPHVHGLAHLEVALAGAQLEALFRSPAANIVGFENTPATPSQQRRLETALERLRAGKALLRPDTAAGCALEQVQVEHVGASGQQGQGQGQGHGHEHGPADVSSDADGHSEIQARYLFSCRTPGQLRSLRVELLQEFPGVETLEAQVVTPDRQYGTTLTRRNRELSLR